MTDPLPFFPFPFFQKNVHSTRFVTYFCEHVLPNLSALTSPVAELDIQLEVRQNTQTFTGVHLFSHILIEWAVSFCGRSFSKPMGVKKFILYTPLFESTCGQDSSVNIMLMGE